jgi:hypothetical protein
MAKFLRHTLRLPQDTSAVILMLESGQKPAFTYCMRRTASFVYACSIGRDQYLLRMVQDRQFMTSWNTHILSLANKHARANGLPPMRMPTRASNCDVVHSMSPSTTCSFLKAAYDESLLPYTTDTPHNTQSTHRTTSTYVQEIWNKRIANTHHARHPFYALTNTPYSHYRAWLRMRTLTLGLPAYHHHSPLSSTCHLACNNRGDLAHWLMACTPVQLEYSARYPDSPLPTGNTWKFFNDRKEDMNTLVQQVHAYCCLLDMVPFA